LTRVTCAGIIDADDLSPNEIAHLESLGIKTLPVTELENLLLLPMVAKSIAEHEGHVGAALDAKLRELNEAVFTNATQGDNIEKCVARYCRRRIDRLLKKIDLSNASTISEISTKFATEVAALNINTIANAMRDKINRHISDKDISGLMTVYDNKGLLSIVATHLRSSAPQNFESWLLRVLSNDSVPKIKEALLVVLPQITAQ
jgi:hypothetical protein